MELVIQQAADPVNDDLGDGQSHDPLVFFRPPSPSSSPAPTTSSSLSTFDALDHLLVEYHSTRQRIMALADLVVGEATVAMRYFIEGASDRDARWGPTVESLFDQEKAIAALNSEFWSRALALTDVLDLMPQKRRDEWQAQIRERTTPDFEEATVRATIQSLLDQRAQFFSERVDGIFRGLSGQHVTNAPEGFGRRMIVAGVVDQSGWANTTVCGRINDLRCVIAKFMGRDAPRHNATSSLVKTFQRNMGQWMPLDGGNLRIKLFKKGTAHLEVHPEMAWRLNQILAQLYPMAIPSQLRQRPERKIKDFLLMGDPLPFEVLRMLGGLIPAKKPVFEPGKNTQWVRVPNTWALDVLHDATGSRAGLSRNPAFVGATAVLCAIGGVQVQVPGRSDWFEFDYDPQSVIDEVITSGCVPERKSHQFYPTSERLARLAVQEAAIGSDDECLEPSAGTGALAAHMPVDQTLCIDVAPLHVKVLSAKGYKAEKADFLAWAKDGPGRTQRFDKILMNPPYSEGRWQAHTTAAAALVKPGGRLVAILPAGAAVGSRPLTLPGFDLKWSEVFSDEFVGTSIRVVILTAERISP